MSSSSLGLLDFTHTLKLTVQASAAGWSSWGRPCHRANRVFPLVVPSRSQGQQTGVMGIVMSAVLATHLQEGAQMLHWRWPVADAGLGGSVVCHEDEVGDRDQGSSYCKSCESWLPARGLLMATVAAVVQKATGCESCCAHRRGETNE